MLQPPPSKGGDEMKKMRVLRVADDVVGDESVHGAKARFFQRARAIKVPAIYQSGFEGRHVMKGSRTHETALVISFCQILKYRQEHTKRPLLAKRRLQTDDRPESVWGRALRMFADTDLPRSRSRIQSQNRVRRPTISFR